MNFLKFFLKFRKHNSYREAVVNALITILIFLYATEQTKKLLILGKK
jgi:NADPH-dependent 7-cyano-7-deazaguanine reductase QueF